MKKRLEVKVMDKANKLKKIKYIIKESFSGKKESQEIFADLIFSEYEENSKIIWTQEQENDIIRETDNSQESCCSRKE